MLLPSLTVDPRDEPDDAADLAARLDRLHANDPQFRGMVARAAPRLHAILAESQTRRLVPIGVVSFVVGVAVAIVTTGIARITGAIGAAAAAAVLLGLFSRSQEA